MKTTTKVIFASALMLAAAAPTLSHAAYFVDQTKTWAVEARAECHGQGDRSQGGHSSNTSFEGTKPWILSHRQHVSARSGC